VTGSVDDPSVHYVCQRCGNCCRWPGEVRLHDAEVLAIARHLGLSPRKFTAEFTRLRRNRQGLTLTETADGACIFLEENRCSIHPVKPAQCRGFPNAWTFPGWRDQCEAIPVPIPAEPNPPDAEPAP